MTQPRKSPLLDLPEVFSFSQFEHRLFRAGKMREEIARDLADALYGAAPKAVMIGEGTNLFLNLALRATQMKSRHGMLQSRAFDQRALKAIFPEAMIGGRSALYHHGWTSRVATRMALVIPAHTAADYDRITGALRSITPVFDGFRFCARREPDFDRTGLVSRTEGILPMMCAEYALADLVRYEQFSPESEDLDIEEVLELADRQKLVTVFRQLDVEVPSALRLAEPVFSGHNKRAACGA